MIGGIAELGRRWWVLAGGPGGPKLDQTALAPSVREPLPFGCAVDDLLTESCQDDQVTSLSSSSLSPVVGRQDRGISGTVEDTDDRVTSSCAATKKIT